jgi:hypothetical protein
MTLPNERFRAIRKTRHLLAALCDPKRTPGLPAPIRQEASSCLKHFPTEHDISEAVEGLRLAAQVFALVEPIPRRKYRKDKDSE